MFLTLYFSHSDQLQVRNTELQIAAHRKSGGPLEPKIENYMESTVNHTHPEIFKIIFRFKWKIKNS